MKILYVEDDPLDADLTRRALQKSAPHISLDVARTCGEAFQCLARETQYDALLTDLNLPDGSGFILLSYVREHHIPVAVIVITGQGDEEIAVSVLKAGADDYMVKRQDYLSRLALTLEDAVQRHRAEVSRQARPLRVLYLESDPNYTNMMSLHFAGHAPHIHLEVVHILQDIFARLPGGGVPVEYDVLMLDYLQYDMNALEVLKELRQSRGLDLPIVLVVGHGDDEAAAQALRLGASDYVVKRPGYLFRLPGLLENAYHRMQLQREQAALRVSEERFRRLAENAPDIIYRYHIHPTLVFEYVSPAVQAISGHTSEEVCADPEVGLSSIHPEDRILFDDAIQEKIPPGKPIALRFFNKDGKIIWLEMRNVPVCDETGNVVAYEGVARDITGRKQVEENLQRQLKRLHTLQIIDAAISASLDLQVTLTVLLEQVTMELGVHAADVLLFNSYTQMLEFGAGTGFRSMAIENLRLRLGEGHAGRAAFQRRTIHAPEQLAAGQTVGLPDLLAEEGFVAYYGTPLIAKGQVRGVLEIYHRLPLEPDAEWVDFFETLAGQAAIAIDNAGLFNSLQRANLELILAYDRTLEGWVRALDLRDKETLGHTQRVTEMTMRLARAVGMGDAILLPIRRGALLHDIGKMGIPDNILHKPGPLTDDEWEIMRKHPEYAYELLSPIEYLRQALEIPYYHHERWDGTGYPQRLKGEQIPLAARIFAVVDVWDALREDRAYRQAWAHERVLEYIQSQSGSHFDPWVVDKFLPLARVHRS